MEIPTKSSILGQIGSAFSGTPLQGKSSMMPISLSGSSSASQDVSSAFNGGTRTAGDTQGGSAARVYNITVGKGNAPTNTTPISQGSPLSTKTLLIYAGIAAGLFLLWRLFPRK